jgi:hypothetical protein
MPDWDNFYMLVGGTAGTLIGLIFVVITLGAECSQAGDTHRTRIFVTPILVQFGSRLLIALVLVAPTSAPSRALVLGVIGCAGLAYASNLAASVPQANRRERARAPVGRPAPDRGLYFRGDIGGGLGAERVLRRRDCGDCGGASARGRGTEQLDDHAGDRGTE